MKLALKIVAVCLVAMILITALSSYLIAKREIDLEKERHQSHVAQVGDIVRDSVDLAYNSEGQAGIIKAIRTHAIESGRLRYRWVWFDVSVTDPDAPTVPTKDLDKILGGEVDSIVITEGENDQLNTYYPIDINDETNGQRRKGAIEISGSLEEASRESWRAIKTGLGAIALMTLFCLGFVLWAGIRLIGRPLSILIEQTRKIGQGDYDNKINLNTNDELSELATSLNRMSDQIAEEKQKVGEASAAKLSAVQQLRHADRLKTVGRLAAGLAHEIGTPLNVVSGRAGLIRSGKLNDQELSESAAAIQMEADRISAIVRQLLDFARHTPANRQPTDVRSIVSRTVDLLRPLADKSAVELKAEFDNSTPMTANIDETQIQQVLTNVVMNAIQASHSGGTVIVRLPTSIDGMEHDYVAIEIEDFGSGMDLRTVENIFEPFFTTKEVGQGTGLGLSIAHGIVEEHGGTIRVESELGFGTTFRVTLPKD